MLRRIKYWIPSEIQVIVLKPINVLKYNSFKKKEQWVGLNFEDFISNAYFM